MNLKISKKLSRRGKIGLAVLIAAMFIGVASAGVLTHYGSIETTATISPALDLNGHSWNDPIIYKIGNSAVPAGNTYVRGPVPMENHADSPIPVTFETTPEWWNSTIDSLEDASDAVTVRYFGELLLENKDPSDWGIISGDGISGNLKYYLYGPTFDYEFSATGLLQKNTEYSLIYYADKPDRFTNWGGNNPGAIIDTFTTDDNGDITLISHSVDLGMDLPSGEDANIDEYDYSGSPDNYVLHHGAKIWLVPTSELPANWPNDHDMWANGWNPTEYLFETNLISYDDTEVGTEFIAYQGTTNFWIEYTFISAAMPGQYTITTKVVPVI